MKNKTQKLTSCIWYSTQAEEAVNYYISLFKDGEITSLTKYGEGEHGKPGTVRTISFKLFGQEFLAINGGDYFKLSEAFSILFQTFRSFLYNYCMRYTRRDRFILG